MQPSSLYHVKSSTVFMSRPATDYETSSRLNEGPTVWATLKNFTVIVLYKMKRTTLPLRFLFLKQSSACHFYVEVHGRQKFSRNCGKWFAVGVLRPLLDSRNHRLRVKNWDKFLFIWPMKAKTDNDWYEDIQTSWATWTMILFALIIGSVHLNGIYVSI